MKGQPSAMGVYQIRRNGQTQPGAASGGFGGKKGITQAGQMLGRNTHALIGDFQDQAVVLGHQARRHAHPTPRVWQGFQGIHNEIDHHVRQVLGIAPHGRQRLRQIHLEVRGFPVDEMAEETHATLDRVIEAHRLLAALGVWPCKIPQVVDDVCDVLGTSVQILDK